MPRKKTAQPPPLDSFIIDDTTIELRDHTCRLLGRGLHKRHEFEEWRDKVAQWVIPQYLNNNGRKQLKTQDDFLVSANKFSATLSNKRPDLYPISGDDSSVRKRLYPYLIKEILVLTRAIDEVKRKGTSQAQR